MAPKRPLGNPPSDDESSSDEEIVEASPQVHKPKKRGAETSTKKMKASGEDEKKVAFQRIWSDEDVIAILEGMIAFKKEKGVDDLAGFCDYIKDAIHISVSKSQMSDKIRALKKKYHNNAKRGKDPVFSKPHEHTAFHLSKLIWGAAPAPKVPTAVPQLEVPHAIANADDFWASYPSLHKSIDLLPLELRSLSKDVMPLVSPSKVKEMDQEWHKFNLNKYNLIMKKAQLFLDVSRAIGFGQVEPTSHLPLVARNHGKIASYHVTLLGSSSSSSPPPTKPTSATR